MRNAVWYLAPFVAGLIILQLIGFRFENGPKVFSFADLSGGSRSAADFVGTEASVPPPASPGRLSQVQDEYLQRLLKTPGDEQAMRRLVAVRRRLAGDNPLTLLRHSAALQQAVAPGRETAEQYSEDRMRVLALADTRAAAEVLAERGRNPGQSSARATSGLTRNTSSAVTSSPRSSASSIDSHGAPSGSQASADPSTPGRGTTNEVFPAVADPKQATFTVSVRNSDAPIVSIRGQLVAVDCQQRAFMLHNSNGDDQYFAAPNIVMYLRGSQSEKLVDFCGLQHFLGDPVLVWSTVDGHRNISTALSVLMPAP